jgi:hypothetical protein
MRRVLPDGEILDVLSWQFDRDLLRNDQVVDTSTIVVRRKRGVVFSRVPRRRGEFPGEDWEFVFRLSRRLRTRHVPDVTVEYSINPGSYYTSWGRNLVSENR